jgi:beta-lactamase class A
MMGQVIDLEALFAEAGVTAAFHAVDLETGREVAHHADDLAVTASVFKLPVLLELCRQHTEGEIDASAPIQVPVEDRAPGPNGLSVMQDPMTMSLRDLAWLMMGISDNAATDVVCAHVGLDNVEATLRRLGLTRTRVGGDCRNLFRTIVEDLGIDSIDELTPSWEALEKLRALDPERTLQVSTPREITRLLTLIWTDQAAPAEACSEARRILGLQVWPHRLASGFADDDAVKTSGKTGTLPTIRNEVGVVEYPDGGRYAVAVFTRSSSLAQKNPAVDAVIGRAARLAVDALRGA